VQQAVPAAEPAAAPDETPVRVASIVVRLQGVALLAAALAYGAYAFVGHPASVPGVATSAALGVVVAAAMIVLGWALGRHDRWAFTPTLLLELLCLPVAWGLAQAHLWWDCGAVAGPAVVVLTMLFTPAGRAVLRGE
jgi:hypothetical protein